MSHIDAAIARIEQATTLIEEKRDLECHAFLVRWDEREDVSWLGLESGGARPDDDDVG